MFGWRRRHRGGGSGLSFALPTNSHPLVLALESSRRGTDNPKTDVVVPVVRLVPVTIRRATVPGVVVPRSTAQHPEVPAPSSRSRKDEICE